MYIIDTKTENGSISYVALELTASRDALNRVATIRPVFTLSDTLKPEWFQLNASRDWFLLQRAADKKTALIEVDLIARDYRNAVNPLTDKLVKLVGPTPALVRDFDPVASVLTYIETESQRLRQIKVTAVEGDLYDFQVENHLARSRLLQAAEADGDGKTPFEYFVRLNDVWAFGKYQTTGGKVNLMVFDDIISLEARSADQTYFGQNIWISDTIIGDSSIAIVGVSSFSVTDTEGVQGKIEFYSITKSGSSYKATQMQETLKFQDSAQLSEARFVKGDFVWQPL